MIQIDDVHKSFGEQRVLDGVNLTINTGESIVILGRSGSGKSVLLKLIIGLLKPDAGTITVDENHVSELPYDELAGLRKRMGMVFQMAALFDSMTVAENVGLALHEHSDKNDDQIRAVVENRLAMVNLQGTENKKPSDLSGGMRKRVGLARAIAMNPDYILYDEPTTGLDPVTAQQINVLIRSLQEMLNVTSIVVTHDMQSAFYVGDRLCLLHEGRIRFDGTPDQIRESDDPVVRQFIRAEAEGPLTSGMDEPVSRGPAGVRGFGGRP